MLVPFDEKLKDIALKIKDIAYNFGLIADYVVEEDTIPTKVGRGGYWKYRKWNSGEVDCWYRQTWADYTLHCNTAYGYVYISSRMHIDLPFSIYEGTATIGLRGSGTDYAGSTALNEDKISFYWINPKSYGSSGIYGPDGIVAVNIQIQGRWK